MASKTLEARLIATDNMSPAFERAGNAAKTLGSSLNEIGKSNAGLKSFSDQVRALDSEIKTVGQAMTGFGAGITAAIAVSVNQFAGLEAAMANVGTIAGQSDAWLAGMTEQIKSLAIEMGSSPTGLAEGLYDLIGSGIAATDALDVLRVSATAAKAGLTDTGTAARAITAVINAYGKSASEAGDISDVLFKTVDSGVISFEELANSMGRALPLANILKVSIEDLGAAYAQLTREGLNAGEAETAFAALLTSALSPTEALTEAVREYGYESAEAMIQTEGFTAFLQFLDEAAAGSATRMYELTGNVKANQAALILAQDGASGFTDRLMEMDEASGATALAFERQMDTIAGSTSRLQASLSVLAATVGEAFAPFAQAGIDAAAGAVNTLTSAINALPGPLDTVAAGLAGVTGGAALLTGGLLLMLPRIVETRAALQTLGGMRGVFGMLAGAVSPLSIALTGLVGVGVLIYENMQRGAEGAKNYAESIDLLTASIEELRIQGDDTRANLIENLMGNVDDAAMILDNAIDKADELNTSIMDVFNVEGVDPTQFSIMLAEDFDRAIALADDVNLQIGRALSNPHIDETAYYAEVKRLLNTIEVTAEGSNIDEVFQQILDLKLSDFRKEVDETADTLANFSAALDTTDQAWRDWQEGMGPFDPGSKVETVEWDDFVAQWEADQEQMRQDAAALAEGQRKAQIAWRESALAVGGFDNALSQLNLSGAANDASLFAEQGVRIGEAFENTFRVLVTNVQGLGQGIQQATDWMEDLVTVNDEGWSKVGQLVSEQRISWEQGEAAVAAYNQTLEANYDIQQNLLAVQAMQAPFIAESVAATQQWVQELANMDAQAQRTTLAMMDMQTVGQTQELIALASADAFKSMGDEGRQLWEAMFMGAAQANPMLLETAEAFGYIEQTANGIQFNWDAILSGGDAISQLTEQVGYLVDTLRQIHGLPPIAPEVDMSSVEAAASPGGPLGLLKAGFDNLRDAHATPTVDVQVGDGTGGAVQDIETLRATIIELDGLNATATVNVISGSAAVGDGTGGAQNWSDILNIPETIETMLTVSTSGDDALRQVVEDLDGVPESTPATLDIAVTGLEEVTTAQETIDALDDKTVTVDVVIGTNELDTGLAQFGIGTGGGGGPAGYTAPSVTVNVEADASDAIAQLEAVAGAAAAADALSVNIPAGAPGAEDASQKLEYLAGRAAAADALSVTVPVDTPGSQTGIDQLQGVAGAAAAADAMSVTIPVSVSGAYTAIAQLNDVANAAANANRTVTITTYHRTVGVGVTAQHGGIPSYATGGVVFRGAEGNRPEIAHFANGGTALLPRDGLYMAPPMTYISPHNSSTSYGGDTIYETTELHIHGNVYGIDDLAEAFEGAISRRRRAYGLEANA